MPTSEGTPNINNTELNSYETGIVVNANIEGEQIPEDLEIKAVEGQEQGAEELVLSPEEQLENLETEAEARKEEMTRLSESIEETKSAINAVREKLGLPPIIEDPPSVLSNKDQFEKLQAEQDVLEKQKEELVNQQEKEATEQANRQEEKQKEDEGKNKEGQESNEGGESFKENELIVPDDEVGLIVNLLEKDEIPCTAREYTKRKVIDSKTGTEIPGVFVLAIFDPEHPSNPASFDFVKQVFKLIKDSNMVVRYGNNPEQGQ